MKMQLRKVITYLQVMCVAIAGANLAWSETIFGDDLIFECDFELGTLIDWSDVVGGIPPTVTITLPGGVTMDLVYIPAGTFEMGSPVGERGRIDYEDLHEVTLTSGYYMGLTEVTQWQWEAVMGTAMPSSCGDYGIGPDYPVYCVSWDDIAASGGFVELLNAHLANTGQPGAGLFRLPTEAEWERAARGGTQTEFSFAAPLDWDLECGSFAEADPYMWWCGNDSPVYSKPVGTKQANPFGLKDMHGNIWEWVEDRWLSHLGYNPVIDPIGPATGLSRVNRGGSWLSFAKSCRSAYRASQTTSYRYYGIGFRIARFE